MSNPKYFLVFYNSENENYIEQITRSFQNDDLQLIIPQNTISHRTGQPNIFFLENPYNNLSPIDISNFYINLIREKNGSNFYLFKNILYVYEVDSIKPYL